MNSKALAEILSRTLVGRRNRSRTERRLCREDQRRVILECCHIGEVDEVAGRGRPTEIAMKPVVLLASATAASTIFNRLLEIDRTP